MLFIAHDTNRSLPAEPSASREHKQYRRESFVCTALLNVLPDFLGTLRSNEADRNENVKKYTKGLISKTITLHLHQSFLYLSFLFLHDFDVKMPNSVF